MEKYFIIEQPPISSKYRLLVDDINDYKTVAIATDVEKVSYNRKLLEQDLDIHLETYTALSDKGITTVLPIGRYVTIWRISKDEKQQEICFVDYDTKTSFRKASGDMYSENVYDEFEKIQSTMQSKFEEANDTIELVLINDNM